jgi:uncharacterized membrane protein
MAPKRGLNLSFARTLESAATILSDTASMFDFDWLAILLLAALAFPVIAIVALVMTISLRDLVHRLDARLGKLERELAHRVTAPSQTAAAVVTERQPSPPPPAAPTESPASLPPSPPPPPPPQQSAPASVPPVSAASPAPPRPIGFEERFGTRWVVWVGGMALALGGIFLVRYTIQQGLIGPGVRVTLGALLAFVLVAAGEWARRRERLSRLPGLPSADIPSILTASSTTVAYATVYAAYALYGFLPMAAAFILLGIVALLTLGAALLHGPALAGLGVAGAFIAPLLVASTKPDYWSLYIYVAVVTAAAFALARARLWPWLAVAAIVLGALWTVPGADAFPVEAIGAHEFNAVAGFVLAAAFIVSGLLYGPPAVPGEIDWLSTLALSVYLLVAALLVLASREDPVALTVFVILTAATVAIAWRNEAATGAVAVAAIHAAGVMADWAIEMNISRLIAPAGPAAPAIADPQRYDYGSHLLLGTAWAALFGVTGFLAQGRSARALVPMLWSATGVFGPLAMLIALYYRIGDLDRSLTFAGFALLLAAIFGIAPNRWRGVNRVPASRRRAQYTRPARSLRSRSHSPSPSRRAGSPSDWH